MDVLSVKVPLRGRWIRPKAKINGFEKISLLLRILHGCSIRKFYLKSLIFSLSKALLALFTLFIFYFTALWIVL